MKLKRGAWDGAQKRTHVLSVLRKHGVEVEQVERKEDFYLLIDSDGDPRVMHIPAPVPSEVVVALYRYFGHHGFKITDLTSPNGAH